MDIHLVILNCYCFIKHNSKNISTIGHLLTNLSSKQRSKTTACDIRSFLSRHANLHSQRTVLESLGMPSHDQSEFSSGTMTIHCTSDDFTFSVKLKPKEMVLYLPTASGFQQNLILRFVSEYLWLNVERELKIQDC